MTLFFQVDRLFRAGDPDAHHFDSLTSIALSVVRLQSIGYVQKNCRRGCISIRHMLPFHTNACASLCYMTSIEG